MYKHIRLGNIESWLYSCMGWEMGILLIYNAIWAKWSSKRQQSPNLPMPCLKLSIVVPSLEWCNVRDMYVGYGVCRFNTLIVFWYLLFLNSRACLPCLCGWCYVAYKDHFMWFCHTWSHSQPHLYNLSVMEEEMSLNKQFMKVSYRCSDVCQGNHGLLKEWNSKRT